MNEPPRDWPVKPLLEIVTITSGQVDPRLREYRKMPLIAPDHIESATGRLLEVRTAEQQRAISGKYRVDAGDIIYSKIRPYLQKAYLAEFPALCSADMYPLTPKPGVDGSFIVNTLLGQDFTSFAVGVSMRSGIPKINRTELAEYRLAVPPTVEQERIGAALADTDALIGSLERLIAKKRDLKQGLMQELLTSRTRLPGFSGQWQTRSIGDFAQVKAGGTPSTSVPRYWGGQIRWMSSGEIHKKRVAGVDGRITEDGLRESAAQLLPVGTVLVALAGQGKTRGTVAVSEVELATNQSIAGILPSGTHDPEFLYYNLDTRYKELRGESAGDGGRGGLNLTIIKMLHVRMPELEEQQAISGVLRDADAEVRALSRRLESARNIKEGMMQELLTGRTRLVSDIAA